jgi:hypothetical protein
VDEARLSGIAAEIREEVGEGWESDPELVEGRNAARTEHGLPRLGEAPERGQHRESRRRPWYRRLLGR